MAVLKKETLVLKKAPLKNKTQALQNILFYFLHSDVFYNNNLLIFSSLFQFNLHTKGEKVELFAVPNFIFLLSPF